MSDYIPPKEKVLNQHQANKLMQKLKMKYGAELNALTEQMKQDVDLYGYVLPETQAKRELVIERIKAEEAKYK